MAKGLGAILAANKLADEKARIESGKSVACPLCGHEMEFNGCAWFCYAEECSTTRQTIFDEYRKQHSYPGAYEDFQSVMLAAIVEDNKILVEFRTVRGGGGRTNFKVQEGEGVDRASVANLIKNGEWLWLEWIPGK
jgi:hypothetical protein